MVSINHTRNNAFRRWATVLTVIYGPDKTEVMTPEPRKPRNLSFPLRCDKEGNRPDAGNPKH